MPTESADADSRELSALLEFLKDARGFDFTGYKRSTLRRRIEKRIAAAGVDGCVEYQEHLEVNPREFTELFNTILINVTAFFRDSTAWDFLSEDVIPQLLEARPDPVPIRVWSAGCASGEEPYTAAMVLCEAMGEEEFARRVKIYATDWDEDALTEARNGVYSNDAAKGIPEPLIDKYFVPNPRGLAFRPDLRRKVIFGRNDVVADAPISRIDLLVCRNVLMYFTPETQAHILERLNFALSESGYLFLGKSEMLVGHSEFFTPYNLHARVFCKVPRANLRERLAFIGRDERFGGGDGELAVRSSAAAMSPVAQIVVDANGVLVDANLSARGLLAIGDADLGRPFRDLALSYRPLDLRGAIDSAYVAGAPVNVGRVDWPGRNGEESVVEVEVSPVPGSGGRPLGATIMFTDVTALARIQKDYQRSRNELETAYEELQSTVEELETTNEELQSTNEELETTNEELQSTNEELETMNEELQSTNDELETMNTEVHARAGELDRLNVFLEGILGTLGVGVVVIDQDRKIQIWNTMATDIWGLRPDEVDGVDFMSLDIGLPVGELDDAIARAFGGATAPIEERVGAVNRRGRAFDCVVRVMSLRAGSGEIYGAMLLTTPA
jgi:two-component system, chemotaxis family, CheB/CheR fusion protein